MQTAEGRCLTLGLETIECKNKETKERSMTARPLSSPLLCDVALWNYADKALVCDHSTNAEFDW